MESALKSIYPSWFYTKVSKLSILTGLYILVLFNSFDAFFFMLPNRISQVIELVLLAYFLTYYIINWRIRLDIVSILILFYCALPFFIGYRAMINFGQPYLLGIWVEKNRFFAVLSFFMYANLARNKQSLRAFINAVLTTMWCLFALYCFAFTIATFFPFLIPVDNISIITKDGGQLLRYSVTLFAFGAIYYIITFHRTRKKITLLYTALLFLYIMIIKDARGIVLYIIACSMLYALFNLGLAQKIVTFFWAIVGFIIITALAIATGNNFLPSLVESFTSIFSTFSSGEGDTSIMARLAEFKIALDWLGTSPSRWLLGAGNLTNSYKGGFDGIFGHFYITDIGVLGMIFAYGLILFLIFKIFYIIIFLQIRKTKHPEDPMGIFRDTVKYFTLFIFLYSLQTGSDTSMKGSHLFLFLLAIAFYYKKYTKMMAQKQQYATPSSSHLT